MLEVAYSLFCWEFNETQQTFKVLHMVLSPTHFDQPVLMESQVWKSSVLVVQKETSASLFCVVSRFYRAWTTFTLSVKSSTQTSSLRTSCCVWRSSPTKYQQGTAAAPLYWLGKKPSPQAQLSLFYCYRCWRLFKSEVAMHVCVYKADVLEASLCANVRLLIYSIWSVNT